MVSQTGSPSSQTHVWWSRSGQTDRSSTTFRENFRLQSAEIEDECSRPSEDFLVELDLKREFLSMNCLVGKDLGRWPALEGFYLFSFVNCSSLKWSTWQHCSTILCQQLVATQFWVWLMQVERLLHKLNVCCNLYKPWSADEERN